MGSVKTADPVTRPVVVFGVPTVGVPATGVPTTALTGTVMTPVVVRTPLDTVMVNVSVVLGVAVWRWPLVGV